MGGAAGGTTWLICHRSREVILPLPTLVVPSRACAPSGHNAGGGDIGWTRYTMPGPSQPTRSPSCDALRRFTAARTSSCGLSDVAQILREWACNRHFPIETGLRVKNVHTIRPEELRHLRLRTADDRHICRSRRPQRTSRLVNTTRRSRGSREGLTSERMSPSESRRIPGSTRFARTLGIAIS